MFKYIPNTDDDISKMLEKIGVESVDDLFSDIPESLRLQKPLNLPAPLSEIELERELKEISSKNADASEYKYFTGGGAYNHYIPSIVNHLISRAEFYTAYTPYQPEVSQGTLQGIFEYQTMISDLLEMDLANASMYDGASAFAEAVLMSSRIRKKGNKVLIPKSLNPAYRQVMDTYTNNTGIKVIEIPYNKQGQLDLDFLKNNLDNETISVSVQNPNYFGCIEDLSSIAEVLKQGKSFLIGIVTEALSLGLLKSPGHYGADILVGEGQSLGIPVSFGGPYLGLFASKKEYMRQVPGRLCGETLDTDGKRGFVLTISTREQHIRREKATSNICSNQGLCALMTAIYMSTMGKQGMREVATINLQKANYAREKIRNVKGYELVFETPSFNEFLVKCPKPTQDINRKLLENKMVGGLDISCYYPELSDCMLFTMTELVSKDDIDRLCEILEEVAK